MGAASAAPGILSGVANADDVLTALRNELIARGLVRKGAGAGDAPPAYVDVDELLAPGDRPPQGERGDPTLVVGLSLSTELGEDVLDGWRRRVVIAVRYRSRTTAGLKRARRLDEALRRVVTNPYNGAQGYTLGGLFVLSSAAYGGLGPIARSADGVRDEAARYVFEVPA